MNYETVQFGSTGDAVRQLQDLLKKQGYNIAVDGSFGKQTQAAVEEYQKKNGLTVDGVVGKQTWGKLYAPASATDSKSYTPSQEVISAGKAVQELKAERPGEYVSPYADALGQLYDRIVNRPAFSYHMYADPLYQQYRDSYVRLGRLAMEDTMGRAAGLTGGYGSTYSQRAGQESYHGYLQELNRQLPQLYDLALSKYAQEGQGLMDQYKLLQGMENEAYSRHADDYDRWYRAYTYAQSQYDDAREEDYDRYLDMLDYLLAAEKAAKSGSGGSSGKNSGDISDKELKKLARSYMAQGHTSAYGAKEMVAWMHERGISQYAYRRFYELLSELGYEARGGGGGGLEKDRVNMLL